MERFACWRLDLGIDTAKTSRKSSCFFCIYIGTTQRFRHHSAAFVASYHLEIRAAVGMTMLTRRPSSLRPRIMVHSWPRIPTCICHLRPPARTASCPGNEAQQIQTLCGPDASGSNNTWGFGMPSRRLNLWGEHHRASSRVGVGAFSPR